MYISAGYNLSHIEGLSDLSLTEIQLSNVKNLTELDISTATAITTLSLSGSDKLKSVNLAGCESLKIELNLSECPNIESIDISSSGVSSIIFP
jgi:Leucine-rich repeat (LRR) protein